MRVALFDTETTDLMPNSVIAMEHRPHVIEFYGMILELQGDAWTKVAELEFFCKPPVQITEEVQRITGIKPEDVRDAPRFSEKADALRAFFEDADLAVAHNLSYDMGVINTEMERLGLMMEWPRDKLCTVEATEHLKGYRLKLSDLHEHLFGEPFSGAHRARVDVEAMGRCFVKLWEDGEI